MFSFFLLSYFLLLIPTSADVRSRSWKQGLRDGLRRGVVIEIIGIKKGRASRPGEEIQKPTNFRQDRRFSVLGTFEETF